MYFIIEKSKEKILDFSKGMVKILWFYFVLKKCWYKMTQYNTLNLKLSNSQLNNLKYAMKNVTEVTLNL